jgi:RND family efflux transporter MFP subunit
MTHVPTGEMGNVVGRLRGAALRDEGAPTDGQLLEAFVVRGDSPAFEALVRRHAAMVLGVCRRVAGHAHDADDAFQATFLVLVRKAGSVVPRDLVGNWLYGVAYKTALKARALAGRRRQLERPMTDIPPRDANADDRTELLRLLDRELARLPAKYRLPIVLCDLEGRTRREAARQLGLPTGTLSGRLTIARKLLAKRLGRHGLAITGTTLGVALAEQAATGASNEIVSSTIQAAALFAAGSVAAAGIVPTQAAALAEGVLKTMLLGKLKVATAVLAGVVLLGAGVLAYDGAGPGGQQPPAREAGKPPAKRDTIEEAQAKADLAAAKASVDLAAIDVNQAEEALRKAHQQLERAQAEYQRARLRAKEAEKPAEPPAKSGPGRDALTVLGALRPARTVHVTSAVAGIVTEVSVREGDMVRAGQLLVTLDSRPLQAEVERAQVNVELAQARLQEAKAGSSDATIQAATAAARIQVAEAELKRAALDLNQAKAQMEKTRLYAPIEGIIARRQVEVGDIVNPTQGAGTAQLFEIIDPRGLLVSVAVHVYDLGMVAAGQAVRIESDVAPGTSMEGKVARVAPTVDRATATARVEIEVKPSPGDPRWKPGMTVRVKFPPRE